MATLTTVVSRIDMIVPSTTTDATARSARSICCSGPAEAWAAFSVVGAEALMAPMLATLDYDADHARRPQPGSPDPGSRGSTSSRGSTGLTRRQTAATSPSSTYAVRP